MTALHLPFRKVCPAKSIFWRVGAELGAVERRIELSGNKTR